MGGWFGLTKEKDSRKNRKRTQRKEYFHAGLFRSEYYGMFTDLCVLERSACWVPAELLLAVAFRYEFSPCGILASISAAL